MDGPNVGSGDVKAFRMFALKLRSLVSMLEQLGSKGNVELQCWSHVSRLLWKLPHDLRSSFRHFIHTHRIPIPTLLDLSDWLEFEIRVQVDTVQYGTKGEASVKKKQRKEPKISGKTTTIFLDTENQPAEVKSKPTVPKERIKKYCPYCDSSKHSLNACTNFKQLTPQKHSWIKDNNTCWHYGQAPCIISLPSSVSLHAWGPQDLRDFHSDVEKLWQIYVLPWRSAKASTRSHQDQEMMKLLEAKTIRVDDNGLRHYAIPLLRVPNFPQLQAPKEAVFPQLCNTEKRLAKTPELALTYIVEIQRFENAGYVVSLESGAEETPAGTSPITWSSIMVKTELFLTVRSSSRVTT